MKLFTASLLIISSVMPSVIALVSEENEKTHSGNVRGRELYFPIEDIIQPSLDGLCGSLGNPPCEDDYIRYVPTEYFLFGNPEDWNCRTEQGQDKCDSNGPICIKEAGVNGQDLCANLKVWNYQGRVDASSTFTSGAGKHDGLYLLVHFKVDPEGKKISHAYTPNAILDNGSTGRQCNVKVCMRSPDLDGLEIDCSQHTSIGGEVAEQCQPLDNNLFFNVIGVTPPSTLSLFSAEPETSPININFSLLPMFVGMYQLI